MSRATPSTDRPRRDFALGEWTIQPSLNRLVSAVRTVRVEPKSMDVLVALADRAGNVLSKSELTAAVWPDVFVTESVLTRAIVALRKALGDDARAPRYIETIAKRGYRLLVSPGAASSGFVAGTAANSASLRSAAGDLAGREAGRANPYSVGQWVSGAKFHGRDDLVREILAGERQTIWLLGSRAVGKTSTLRHLEHLAEEGEERSYLPLYWDLQGSGEPARLAADFLEAVEERADRFEGAGVEVGELRGAGDLFAAISLLRRLCRGIGRTLLLLLDEGEELIALQERSPEHLLKLRRVLQSQTGLRTVIAASTRLWRLNDAPTETSPFLHGFAPPLYLGALSLASARRLLLRPAAAPHGIEIAEEALTEILRLAGGHPYLLQMLGGAYWECRRIEETARAAAADPTLGALYAVDVALLSPAERALLAALAEPAPGAAAAGPAGDDVAAANHLERLGMLRRADRGGFEIASPLFAGWLRTRPPQNA